MKKIAWGLAALLIWSVPASAEVNEFANAKAFVAKYYESRGDNLLLRIYIKGVTDGYGYTNGELVHAGQPKLYCAPDGVGLVDAQFVSILSDFIKKFPGTQSMPPGAVLLVALEQAFPCK